MTLPLPAAEPEVRVMLCDDSATTRAILGRLLESEPGIRVVHRAGDGRAALAALAEAKPDVVLLDLEMPVMDGLTATRAIRANAALAELPVIALTAGVLPTERDKAKAAGVDDFLAKPLDPKRMIAVLAALRASRLRDS